LGRASALGVASGATDGLSVPGSLHWFREAFLLSATNPKPILFFTALFPQFVSAHAPLLPQFLTLTGIFMGMSFLTLLGYALLASRARSLLLRPRAVKWFNRVVGAVFISFGAALLSMRRSAT
jgi:threonine/homoserine/homoserine lactone efflux protein